MNSLIKVVFVVGATGTGKTELGIQIARDFDGECVSADAFQVYDECGIATNTASVAEKGEVKHHLIGVTTSDDQFNVKRYVDLSLNQINDIVDRGKIPIVVGGSSLYLDALLFKYIWETTEGKFDTNDQNSHMKYSKFTNKELHERIQQANPSLSKRIHPNNRRALLTYMKVLDRGGKLDQDLFKIGERKPRFDAIILWIDIDTAELEEKLEKRVDYMVERGLLEENGRYYDNFNQESSGLYQAIGVKEFKRYFDAKRDKSISDDSLEALLAESLASMKKNTIKYARSQVRWIRNRFGCENELQMYRMNKSDPSINVTEVASEIVRIFLENRVDGLHQHRFLFRVAERDSQADDGCFCSICGIQYYGKNEFELHSKSRKHRRNRKRKRKVPENQNHGGCE